MTAKIKYANNESENGLATIDYRLCELHTTYMKHERWKYQMNNVKIATETRRHGAHDKDSMMIEIIK